MISLSPPRIDHERFRLVPGPGRVGEPAFVGSSPAIRQLLERARRLSRTDIPLLVSGESGTGKEVLSRRVHRTSQRASGPFVAENAAAIPESLVESEFFGHVRGAFTGADKARDGAFVRADGGTLFLDEIGDMPLALQAKLLRVLEDGRVRPVGGSESRAVDVRVVCATNQDLLELVAQGRFREDLYYRLNGAELHIPPLRSRPGDVRDLVDHFLIELNREHGVRRRVSEGLLESFERHVWRGNVRELRNRLTLLFELATGLLVDGIVRDSGAPRLPHPPRPTGLVNAVATLAEIERDAIRLALEETGGDRREAARLLGISRSTIYVKLKGYEAPVGGE